MSFDRSIARCSFCGKQNSEVQRMIAGPGAAYICDACLQLCNDILHDPAPFSARALELASRPPVVIAAPQLNPRQSTPTSAQEPVRSVTLELEQKQHDMTIILRSMLYFQDFFELQYMWIRPPLVQGFSFIPRLIFLVQDSLGMQWFGDRGGTLLARPELTSGSEHTVYQGNARFRPLPSADAQTLTVSASDPLAAFTSSPTLPWQFEITL